VRDQPDREAHRRHVVEHAHDARRVAGDLVHHRADAHALRTSAQWATEWSA
jgi:hypothetical protein